MLSIVLFRLFLLLFVCCTACRITSRGGYTTATRWGGTTAIRPGVFSSTRRGFLSFLSLLSFLFYFLLLCSCSVSHMFPSLFFVYFFLYFLVHFIFHLCFVSFHFVFLCLSFFSLEVYRGSWRMYVGSVIAQQNWHWIVLLLSTWYNVAACIVAL